jgi:hypothetical protein
MRKTVSRENEDVLRVRLEGAEYRGALFVVEVAFVPRSPPLVESKDK